MKKQKIPVKIVQAQDMYGNKKIAVMLDVSYYLETKKFSQEKINTFKKLYLETVSEARKLFYGHEKIEKKYQNVPSIPYSPDNAKHKAPPNRSFKLTVVALQKTQPLTLKVVKAIRHYPAQTSPSYNFVP